MDEMTLKSFRLIRVRGTPRWVEFDTKKGIVRVYRPGEGKVFVKGEGFNRFVQIIDYDNHFVALFPDFEKTRGAWFAYCSCGSPAVVAGYNAYRHGASPSSQSESGMIPGEMLVCYHHASTGLHLDGSS